MTWKEVDRERRLSAKVALLAAEAKHAEAKLEYELRQECVECGHEQEYVETQTREGKIILHCNRCGSEFEY
jgi:transcription elongation factor Elf1